MNSIRDSCTMFSPNKTKVGARLPQKETYWFFTVVSCVKNKKRVSGTRFLSEQIRLSLLAPATDYGYDQSPWLG